MKLSVATNFDHELIPQLARYPVYEVYGKLAQDWLGGGRSSYLIPHISGKRLKEHIALVHRHNIRFNYLLNAACLDNLEFTRSGQRKIYSMLEKLTQLKVDSLTITLPYLLRIVKRNFPHFKVRASIFANIDSVEKAKWWEGYGADTLCLNDINTNREFRVLAAIRKAVRCDIQLLANNSCLQNCGVEHYHQNLISHSSQAKHSTKGFVIDYCFLTCTRKRLEHPINYIRGTWIRPEDLHYYEEIGIDNFKIVERSSPTASLVKRVKAYSERHFDGNLLDLVSPIAYSKIEEKKGDWKTGPSFFRLMKYFFKPTKVNLSKLKTVQQAAEKMGALFPLEGRAKVVIPNKELAGFLERFPEKGCRDRSCDECRYCFNWAEKIVKIDDRYLKECLGMVSQIHDDLETSAMFKL